MKVVSEPAAVDAQRMLFGHLHFQGDIARWERDLSAAGLPHVFLKGIGFDRWLDRSETRVSRDIDILCPRSARRPVMQLLKQKRYRCLVTEPNASTWLGPDDRLPIDLHDTLKGVALAPDAVWRAVERHIEYLSVAGMDVPVLASPLRELVAGLHLTLGGLDDERATSDLSIAITRSSRESWLAADRLAASLGSRALFEAAFAATPELRQFAGSLGFAMVGADELLAPRAGRDDAIGLLPALCAGGPIERTRLMSRFLRLHLARLESSEGFAPRSDVSIARRCLATVRVSPKVARKLGARVVRAFVVARRLRDELNARVPLEDASV
jgi:hypothetical protein